MTAPSDPPKEPKSSAFWDSTWGLVLLIAVILFGRFYIAEPFKIPSGSMEPTLFGHEDYGDRILTNKLAYESAAHCALIAGGAIALVLVGFFASRSHRRIKSSVIGGIIFVGTVVGFGGAWTRGAIAGEPQRFDVVVFQYDTDWAGGSESGKSEKINYIKRLCGLPGDHIKIAGGNLYLRDEKETARQQTDVYKIIRKWEVDPALQEELWYPVSTAWSGDVYKDMPEDEAERKIVEEQRARIALPWSGADKGAPGVERKAKSLELTGDGKVELNYLYPVTNIYIKQGRWPFVHKGCPAVKNQQPLKGSSGALFRDPDEKTENVRSYIFHTWEGVQCPNCKEIMFPAVSDPKTDPILEPAGGTPFFYGGDRTVGDLRIDLDIRIDKSGPLTIEVGNTLHEALWAIGGSAPAESGSVHPVSKATSALTPGFHKLSLSYVDATVIASLDGVEIERRPIDVEMPGSAADYMKNVARLSFDGVKGEITRLDLFRDLHYTSMVKRGQSLSMSVDARRTFEGNQMSRNQNNLRDIDEQGRYEATVPAGYYLMLGDNSPSSSDGRVWGFVPRENLVGRASFIGWPPSRARFIR
jgi:signal peptidase I